MTHKDYEAIAKVLRASKPRKVDDPFKVWENCLATFIYELEKDNARFDRKRFMDAAGVFDREVTK